MPMSAKERMQVYRKRLKGILPPSPLRMSASKKVLKERQRAKLAALSTDEAASGDAEESQSVDDADREMPSTRSEQEPSKAPTTDKPFITVIKSNESKGGDVSESVSSEAESEEEPVNKASGSGSNKYALPSPYKNLPSVSVCLKEEDRLLAQRELGRTLQRTSSVCSTSSNGGNDANKPSPVLKRKRAERPAPKVTGRKNDCYCWVCHRENITLMCIGCPRAFHHKCANEVMDSPTNWVCPECKKTLHAEAVDTQSSVLSEISVDKLGSLLKFSLFKMKQRGGAPFHQPVSFEHFPMYPHYVIYPMDFSLLEKNIKQKLYGSTEAFLSDVKWILHNSCVFNGAQHPLSNNAKSVVKNCENDMQEIEICPDCFMHGSNRNNKYWFSEVCGKPHPLVWAKLKGFPYWPAKVVRILDGNVDARFFGAHDRAWVPVNQCYHLSKEMPTSSKPKKKGNYEVSLAELNVHVHLLIQKFGTFEYAPYRQVFDPTNKKFMYHGIDIDKISKEEIPVESTSVVTSEMCSSPMDTGKNVQLKTSPLETTSLKESGKDSLKDEEMDSSMDTPKKTTIEILLESKEDSNNESIPCSNAQEKESFGPSGLNKIQKVLEKIKGIVSNNDDDEIEEDENNKEDDQESSEEPQKTTNETNLKKPEGSIIAGLMKSKPLPSLDIITEDVPEEPPVSIMNTSSRKDLFSLKLIETIESCKAKLGISEVDDSMDIDSEDEDEEEEDEEMESEQEDDNEKKENSGSEEESSEDSSDEESDANQSDSASSNTDIEEVSAYLKDSEKRESHSVPDENNSNSSEKMSEKSRESSKDKEIPVSKESNRCRTSGDQIEKNRPSDRRNMLDGNKNDSEGETDDEDENMSDNNESRSVNDSTPNDSQTNTVEPQEKLSSSADSKELEDESIEESSKGESTKEPTGLTKANESEEDDDIFICDPPPRPPTPPLICLDDGTDETEPEAEEKMPSAEVGRKEGSGSDVNSLLQMEEAACRSAGKAMPKNARKSIKRVARPVTSESSEEEEGEVAAVPPPNRAPLTGAKRTFPNRPAAKRARPSNDQQLSSSCQAETQKDAVAVDDEMEEGPSTRNTDTPSLESEQVVIVDGVFPHEGMSQPISDSDIMLRKMKKRLLTVYTGYKLQRWKFMQEKAEMRHNMNLVLMEMRSSLEAEKRQALDAQSRTLTLERTKCVEEAKRKQWCASCLQESRYACCWNTSYCTLACQKKHFPIHRKTCTQLKFKSSPMNGTAEGITSDGKKVVLLNMVPKADADKVGNSAKQQTVQIPLAKVIAQNPTQLSSSVKSSSIQFVSIPSSSSKSKPIILQKKKLPGQVEGTELETTKFFSLPESSKETSECAVNKEAPLEKKELSLEERYFPSPPTVSFEGLDSALPDESVRFDDLTEEDCDASETEGKKGDSSDDEGMVLSDDEKNTDNELVSLGYGVEVKAKFLNKCLIYGKTAKKLTRCLVDVLFPSSTLLANCSAFGNKSNLTKLTRAALPSRKVACIIEYVKSRFPDASKSEIVLAINLKCKEARAILGKSGTDGTKPVARRLLAKEQEMEAASAFIKSVAQKPTTLPQVQKPTVVLKTSATTAVTATTTVTSTAPITVLRQPPNIVCVKKPGNSSLSVSRLQQQKGIQGGLVQLRLPVSTAATTSLVPRPAASILSKPTTTVLKVPPRARAETIRSLLTKANPQVVNSVRNKILLPIHFLRQKETSGKETTEGSQRPCIIMGTVDPTSSQPQSASSTNQKSCIKLTSTSKKE